MNIQQATFGNGCFWCTEAIFQMLSGVVSVTSGYMGGNVSHPTYMEICNGKTGHVEVININFDADVIFFEELLLVFFKTHNPTILNRQGNDRGTQYRSVIFYHNKEQKQISKLIISKLTKENIFDKPIVTEIAPASVFYKADDQHQNYYQSNPLKPYCTVVIQPKLIKFVNEFVEKINSKFLH